jgi:glycerol-3-phosphate cytidylyltransferase-like family protein
MRADEIMNTLAKIIEPGEAARLAGAGAVVVSGYFDPLVASHARRLAELKREGVPLIVVIASPARPILPPRARAELVASLRVVDHVTELSSGIEPQIRLEQEHERSFESLVAHVHARQNA